MAHVIAFANQKGGVAKTTSTVNLGAALREHGLRVLAVDMDPQGNLTMSQGIDTESLDKSMYDVLVHRTPIEEVIYERELDVGRFHHRSGRRRDGAQHHDRPRARPAARAGQGGRPL